MARYNRCLIIVLLLLAACARPQAPQAAVDVSDKSATDATQIAYRIDADRFFEIVPSGGLSCGRARVYYTDRQRGIHTDVASWDLLSDGQFIIDATNDQYLVAPVVRSTSDCQSGSGTSEICASALYYSQDAGRTWQIKKPVLNSGDMSLIGSKFYVGGNETDVIDISPSSSDAFHWSRFMTSQVRIPSPAKPPIDTRFHCERRE